MRENTLPQLAYRGKSTREAFGVYHFDELPKARTADYRFAVLCTGRADAALSHNTALDLYNVCDINPVAYHVTVPRGKRIRREGGQDIEVHYEDLAANDLGWWEEIRCVTLATAIRQCIDSRIPTYLVHQALDAARARGGITEAQRVQLTERMNARG